MAYWYRGRRYPSKPALKTKVKASLKHLASRAWESIQGGHPGGAEALVERMIRAVPRPSRRAYPACRTYPT